MPPVTRVITSRTGDAPVDTVRTLHAELAAIGLPVTGTERSGSPRFGTETQENVRNFQKLYRLPETGDLDPGTGGVMTLASLVVTESDRAHTRAALRDFEGAVGSSPEFDYWLARSALMVGDYDLAARASPRLIDLSDSRVDLGNGVFTDGHAGGSPRAPEVPFPENFYSYRNDIMSQADISELRRNAPTELAPNARMIYRIAAGGVPEWRDSQPISGLLEVMDDSSTSADPTTARRQALAQSAHAWLDAVEAWQLGNAEFAKQRYASAVEAYSRCQSAVLDYFAIFPDYSLQLTANTLEARVEELVWRLASDRQSWADIWTQINWRRQLLSLAELSEFDWAPIRGGRYAHIVYQLLQGNLAGSPQPPPPTNPIGPKHRKILMDTHLLVMAAVLVPLARGEANRLRRQYAAARDDFARVLRNDVTVPGSDPPQTVPALSRCEFIEAPFARLLLVETMLDQAEAQYKARLSVDDETEPARKAAQLAKLGEIAQDFQNRQIAGSASNTLMPLQHLVAAVTYAEIFEEMTEDGDYVVNAGEALDTLHASVASSVESGDVNGIAFQTIGQTVTVPTVTPVGDTLPGLTNGTHPHEPYLKFTIPAGQEAMRETNPRVYFILLTAQARLLQIWSGFNYLGYSDDYVPPWRFAYLLDRARYFSEHAKNAQRDYLNFLSNAENEEFKEMSAAQNVELEKANVQIETARVSQAASEVSASYESASLAALQAQNAADAYQEYKDFDALADEADAKAFLGSLISSEAGFIAGLSSGNIFGFPDLFNAFWVGEAKYDVAIAERNLEKHNLERTAQEALQAAEVARRNVETAEAGLVVAGLQRQAALLRHEFALQNLQFMRNRTLNTEQWYRLAGGVRSVADTYLRYAIEMAFLAEQAYEFESDRRMNVIRFDYDLSDVGAMLAADFLLRDLDTLEQDLVVGQQTRLQQVRYVLSLAREFPEALRALTESGEAMFSIRLEQLERHFPGLVNQRILSVELQPVALMDPTRVSVALTHLGTGMIRLKAQPGASPLNTSDLTAADDWLAHAGDHWPIKIRVSGPDTAVFSGLSRNEASSLGMITANEREAFEGLPAASSWKIDMSMKENQVVPGTLADALITFTLSAYHDPQLRDAIDGAEPRSLATTRSISARRALPDAYYSLVHYGKLDWAVSERMLSLTGSPNELRNLAVLLPLAQNGLELGRCYCRYPIRIEVESASVNANTILPSFTLDPTGLQLNCAFTGGAGTEVTWDFGDHTPLVHGLTPQHTYTRPGRYEVSTRLVENGRLVEYRSAVVVSENHAVERPLIVIPTLSAGALAADGTVPVTVSLATGVTDVSLDCSAARTRDFADSGPVILNLKPGQHILDFSATRKLSARFFGKQRYEPAETVDLYRGRVATNRTFDLDSGADTTTSPNAFSAQVFASGGATLSPVDRWTLELPLAENPWFVTVSPSDVAEFDGGELADAILSLEFVGTP